MLKADPHCTRCRLHQTSDEVCVLGSPLKPNPILVVGEYPPHPNSRSRELLEDMLEEAGLDLRRVSFANAVSCNPWEAKTPTKSQIKQCRYWLEKQIDYVDPDYILLLGNTPLQGLTGKAGITKARGIPVDCDDFIYLPTVHLQSAVKDADQRALLAQDLELLAKIIKFGGIPEERNLSIKLVRNWGDFEDMLEDLKASKDPSCDLETTGLNPFAADARIISVGFSTERHQWIWPVSHWQSEWNKADVIEAFDDLDKVMKNRRDITFHNGKFDLLWLRVHYRVRWKNGFDTMLAHYLLDENDRHGLVYLCMKYLKAPNWEIDLKNKQGDGPLSQLAKYHAHDLYYTRELRFFLEDWFNNGEEFRARKIFDHIMMPVADIFVGVEYHGVWVDMSKFNDAEKFLRERFDNALARLKEWEPKGGYKDAKGRVAAFNWGSPKQLAWLLYDYYELEVVERTKTGAPSCGESALNQLDHPCIEDLKDFRGAKQQLSFFIEGWKPYLHRKKSGMYLHPSFKLHGTVTGRLSCENPNLQQVPRDKRIRSLISAPKGWTHVDCDLSQIELRVAAHSANEKNLIKVFKEGGDAHWKTCLSEISRGAGMKDLVIKTAIKFLDMMGRLAKGQAVSYGEAMELLAEMGPGTACDISEEWKELRKKAKAVNFGYLFGMYWKKFKVYARDNYGVHIDDDQARESRENFFETYPAFDQWHKDQRKFAREYGYVLSLSGRKRRLPKAQSKHDTPERREAERQAINSPVQSFANDINLMALIALTERYGEDVLRVGGTVHDSILMRIRDEYVEEVTEYLLELMSSPPLFEVFNINLKVPIFGEATVGPWGEGIDYDKWKEAA
jgi:uracil-DNA glycosylase family 4